MPTTTSRPLMYRYTYVRTVVVTQQDGLLLTFLPHVPDDVRKIELLSELLHQLYGARHADGARCLTCVDQLIHSVDQDHGVRQTVNLTVCVWCVCVCVCVCVVCVV